MTTGVEMPPACSFVQSTFFPDAASNVVTSGSPAGTWRSCIGPRQSGQSAARAVPDGPATSASAGSMTSASAGRMGGAIRPRAGPRFAAFVVRVFIRSFAPAFARFRQIGRG